MSPAWSRAPTPAFRRTVLKTIYWFLAVSVGFNLVFGEMGIIQGFRQRLTTTRIEKAVRGLESRNAHLRSEIDDLLHNPYRIEMIARQDLGLCRPGEIIFLFPDGTPLADPPL